VDAAAKEAVDVAAKEAVDAAAVRRTDLVSLVLEHHHGVLGYFVNPVHVLVRVVEVEHRVTQVNCPHSICKPVVPFTSPQPNTLTIAVMSGVFTIV
jgi:hypothetical protein